MKLLLDESLPRGLRSLFPDHEARTVPECGWGGFANGALLEEASSAFDAFITAGQNLQYQQNLSGFPIASAAPRR
jgi:hypothetical protein